MDNPLNFPEASVPPELRPHKARYERRQRGIIVHPPGSKKGYNSAQLRGTVSQTLYSLNYAQWLGLFANRSRTHKEIARGMGLASKYSEKIVSSLNQNYFPGLSRTKARRDHRAERQSRERLQSDRYSAPLTAALMDSGLLVQPAPGVLPRKKLADVEGVRCQVYVRNSAYEMNGRWYVRWNELRKQIEHDAEMAVLIADVHCAGGTLHDFWIIPNAAVKYNVRVAVDPQRESKWDAYRNEKGLALLKAATEKKRTAQAAHSSEPQTP